MQVSEDLGDARMDGGYIRLWRRLWDNPVFRSKQEAAVFAYMVSRAQYLERATIQSKFGPLSLFKGELVIAERELAKDFGLSRDNLRRLLSDMERAQMIHLIRNRIPARAGTVCKVTKYEAYQSHGFEQAENEPEADNTTSTANETATPPESHRKATASQTKSNEDNKSNLTIVPSGRDGEGQLFREESPVAHTPERKPKAKPKAGEHVDHPKFSAVWAAYPSRGHATNGRLAASVLFSKVVARGADPDEILRGVIGYAAAMKKDGKDGTQFVQQTTTFLNGETWRQYATPSQQNDADAARARYHAAYAAWAEAGRQGPPPKLSDFTNGDKSAA